MFIEIHMLQSYSASNLNRDDLNNPKEVWFGGVRRARISSQCFKRAIRTNPIFTNTIKKNYSPRTCYLADKLINALDGKRPGEEVKLLANYFARKFTGTEKANKDDKTIVLLYIGWDEIQMIAQKMDATWASLFEETQKPASTESDKNGKPKKENKTPVVDKLIKEVLKEIGKNPVAPDIALFGRMLAGKPGFGREAACQVAHAISTHAVKVEMDFYTAMDDGQREDSSGAAMMGYIGYNSACYYRYSLLDWNQLMEKKNLGGDTALGRLTVEGYLRAMEAATPTGKKHSFDNNSRPAFLLAVVRDDNRPGWSLINAFEKPVHQTNNSGLITPSVTALNSYWNSLIDTYGDESIKASAVCLIDPNLSADELKPRLGKAVKPSFNDWVKAVVDVLPGG